MWPEEAAVRKRSARSKGREAQAEGAVAPPRTLAPQAEGRRRRTKPRLRKRKRMRGGISRSFQAMPKGSFASRKAAPTGEGRGNRPAAGAGGRRGRAQAPAATRNGVRRKGFTSSRRAPGERQGPRAAPRSERGKRKAGFRFRPSDPKGIGEGFTASPRNPPDAERGLAASLRDPGESEAGVRARLAIQSRPARDGLATQRRQSKLGQVGAGGDTGPHYDSGAALADRAQVHAGECRALGRRPIMVRTKARRHKGASRAAMLRLFSDLRRDKPLRGIFVASCLCANPLFQPSAENGGRSVNPRR